MLTMLSRMKQAKAPGQAEGRKMKERKRGRREGKKNKKKKVTHSMQSAAN